jgi:ferredoxin
MFSYPAGVDFIVRFQPSGREVRVEAGLLLLEAARLVGLPVAASCGANGACSRCGLEILCGAEALAPESERERVLKQRNRIDSRLRLGCRTSVEGDLVVTAPYW